MFGRNKKKALKKQEARVELHRALDETLEKLGTQYTDAINEPDAAKRFLALAELNRDFIGQNNQHQQYVHKIKQGVDSKEQTLAVGNTLLSGMTAVSGTLLVASEALPIVVGIGMFGGGLVAMLAGAHYYHNGYERQEKKVAKRLKYNNEDIADFLKAVNDLQYKITQKIDFEKENNYQDILTAPAYAEFEEKFPNLDKEFAKKAMKEQATAQKLSEKPTYTMPKNGMTPPKPKGI